MRISKTATLLALILSLSPFVLLADNVEEQLEKEYNFVCKHENDGITYFTIRKYGREGAADSVGNIIVPCQFDACQAWPCTKGFAFVKQNGKEGVWSITDQKLFIPTIYDDVVLSDEKYDSNAPNNDSYIRFRCHSQSKQSFYFSNGLPKTKEYTFISPHISHDYAFAIVSQSPHKKGQSKYAQPAGGKFGVINLTDGSEILPIKYGDIYFDKGLKLLKVNKGGKVKEDHSTKGGLYGYYDLLGNEIVPCKYVGIIGSRLSSLEGKLKSSSKYTPIQCNPVSTPPKPVYFDALAKRNEERQQTKPSRTPEPKPLPVVKELPNLEMIAGSLKFTDANGNQCIDANEIGYIDFKVSNSGKGAANDCKPIVSISGQSSGISVGQMGPISVASGASELVRIPISSNATTADGVVNLTVSVTEPNGFGTDGVTISVPTRAFVSPKVLMADYSVTSQSGGAQLQKKVPFDLQVLVQNGAHGNAEDVTASIELPQNVFLMDGNISTSIGALAGGETKSLVYTLAVNNNYTATEIPIKINLREKHGKYGESKTVNLHLNQTLAQQKIEIKGVALAHPQGEIQLASIDGKVQQAETDYNIPAARSQRRKTFALVIGNEKYMNEVSVPFAANDASVVSQYFQSALGLPSENVHLLTNATRNQMIAEIDWLGKVAKAYNNDIEVLVYYSGHGMPDEASGASFLIPVDGYSANTVTCYPTTQFYSELAGLGAKSVTVIMDACFSGAQRGDGMLMAARGVAIKSKQAPLTGQMVVMSASQGDETAFPYREKGHGMFTYFLLKHLQDNSGNTSLGELYNYVRQQVSQRSIVVNNKPQTPQAMTSPSLAETWRSKKL